MKKTMSWILAVAMFISLFSMWSLMATAEEAPVSNLYGDVDASGSIEAKDAVLLKRHLAKWQGIAIDLTAADVVIHYDPWWNLAVQNQATDRAHRIGQTKMVVVYRLIAKGTIEEKIQELQESKRALSEQVIQGDAGQLGGMSKEDFISLLS